MVSFYGAKNDSKYRDKAPLVENIDARQREPNKAPFMLARFPLSIKYPCPTTDLLAFQFSIFSVFFGNVYSKQFSLPREHVGYILVKKT